MELRVVKYDGTIWMPTEYGNYYDAIIEVPDEIAEKYLARKDRFFSMTNAIEAQVEQR